MSEFVDRLTKDMVALLVVQPFHYDLSDLSSHLALLGLILSYVYKKKEDRHWL